jgi:phage terminase large subunit-like protein
VKARSLAAHELSTVESYSLADDGLPIDEFPQNLATFAAPVIEFEKALFERRLVHGGNPILRWAVGNLVFMEDASGNRRPHKAKSIDRIDPAVAAIMSTGRAAANASVSSSYVTQGLGWRWASVCLM